MLPGLPEERQPVLLELLAGQHGADLGFQGVDVTVCRVGAADDRSHAGTGDDVDRDLLPLEGAQHADMSHPARGSTAQRHTDADGYGNVGNRDQQAFEEYVASGKRPRTGSQWKRLCDAFGGKRGLDQAAKKARRR